MTSGSDLATAHALLAALHLADPALELANVTAWLCPGNFAAWDNPLYAYEESDDAVLYAALTARHEFPAIYRDLRRAMDAGESYDELYERAMRLYNDLLFDGENFFFLDDIVYGIPLVGYGVDLADPDWWQEAGDRWADVLGLLGVEGDLSYNDLVPLWEVVKPIIIDLESRSPLPEDADVELILERGKSDPHKLIAMLLRYLMSATANDTTDLTTAAIYESYSYFPEWTREEVEAVREMYAEALDIVTAALMAQEFLNEHPEWSQALAENVERVKERKNGNVSGHRWPEVAHGDPAGDAGA